MQFVGPPRCRRSPIPPSAKGARGGRGGFDRPFCLIRYMSQTYLPQPFGLSLSKPGRSLRAALGQAQGERACLRYVANQAFLGSGAGTISAGSYGFNSVQLAHECPGCRSPCPWYLRDSPPPTRAAACSFGALRVARDGSPDGFDEWCSTGPERVWEFAPSVQRRPVAAVRSCEADSKGQGGAPDQLRRLMGRNRC